MSDQKLELENYFKKMLDEIENLIEVDEILKKDWKDINMKFQWFLNGLKGYQIFERGNYTHKFGEEISNADLTLKFANKELTLDFLKGELEKYRYIYYKRKFKLYADEKLLLTGYYTNDKFYHPYILTKLPIFREIAVRRTEPENTRGSYIPINTSLGTYENQLLPEKLIEYFIKKAKHFYVQNICGCRVFHDCQDHDKTLGCMYIGNDVKNFNLPPEKGRFITQKAALRQVRKAIKNGLIPVFGRSPGETNGVGVEDTGHVMSMCFCCSCCCVNGKVWQNGTIAIQTFSRMDGLTVKVDPDKCVGCGTCLDVCIFVGRNIVDGKAVIDQERCLGCGRCEKVCPNGAINITLDDPKRIDEFIQKMEEFVDVS
ncbi:MAG: DUF362 domain-containing protein [Candidatus Thorarchaeota archaeon]